MFSWDKHITELKKDSQTVRESKMKMQGARRLHPPHTLQEWDNGRFQEPWPKTLRPTGQGMSASMLWREVFEEH